MKANTSEFYSHEKIKAKIRLGHVVASSLSGFIAGIIVTLIIVLSLYELVLKS